MTVKICCSCRADRGDRKDRLCKPCRAAYNRAWRKDHVAIDRKTLTAIYKRLIRAELDARGIR